MMVAVRGVVDPAGVDVRGQGGWGVQAIDAGDGGRAVQRVSMAVRVAVAEQVDVASEDGGGSGGRGPVGGGGGGTEGAAVALVACRVQGEVEIAQMIVGATGEREARNGASVWLAKEARAAGLVAG